MLKKFVAELFGTIVLCTVVLLALTGTPPVPIPVLVGFLILMLMYSIGHVAGLHINPAVTIGLWSIQKIDLQHVVVYLAAQILGASLALLVMSYHVMEQLPVLVVESSMRVWFAEFFGTMLLCIGISSVAHGKVREDVYGIVLGTSVFLGVTLAVFLGSNAMINPVVAFATGSLNIAYLLSPVLGAVAGFQFYRRAML